MGHSVRQVNGIAPGTTIGRDLLGLVQSFCEFVGDRAAAHEQQKAFRRACGSREALEAVLEAHGYAPSTRDKYARIVLLFLAAVPRTPRWEDVLGYIEDLQTAHMTGGTIRTRLCAIRAVFDRILGWGITDGIEHVAPSDPGVAVTGREVRRLAEACVSAEERHLIAALSSRLMPGKACRLGWREGAPAEADGEGTDETLRVVVETEPAQQRRPRVVTFTVQAVDEADVLWLFPSPWSQVHGPVCTRTLQRRLKRIGSRCGILTTCTAVRLAEDVEGATAA